MPGERLDENVMAMRAALEFEDGMIVNLGVGIPTLASSWVLPNRDVIFHSENGVVGFGPVIEDVADADINLINASSQPITRAPGMAFLNHEVAFEMIRGGHIDITVLGALEVGENGDIANYHLPGKIIGSLGGGQDLAFCAKKLIVVMKHVAKTGKPKIVKTLSLPLTAPNAVDLIITDIAVIGVKPSGLELIETAPGWTMKDIQNETDAILQASPNIKDIALS